MPVAFWCVLVAGLLPVLTVGIAKVGGRGYDNGDPRAWLEKQSGRSKRADNAHRNHFEAFPFFAAAVLIATHLGAPRGTLDTLALVFIGARLAYTACYLADKATLRSTMWLIGYLDIIAIFLLPVFGK